MIPDAEGGLAAVAGLCGAAAAAGMLLVAAGLRPAPVQPRRPRRFGAISWARPLLGRRRAFLVLAAVLAGWLVTGWPVVAAAAGLAVAAAPRLLSGSATRRQLDRLAALEAWTRRLADLLGSGAGGLEQAIDMSVRTCPAPIAAEVRTLASRLRVQGPEPALRALADDLADLGSPAADLVAAALILRVRRGGRGLRLVLEALAADVADLVRARRQVEADRAKPRSNMRVLIAITGVVLTLTLVFARDYLSPFTTAAGQVMLAGIVGVFATGIWLLGRITRLPDTPRFLSAPTSTVASSASAGSARSAASAVAWRGSWWG